MPHERQLSCSRAERVVWAGGKTRGGRSQVSWFCTAGHSRTNRDVKVPSQRKRDVIGKWALEQHSPLTHQLLPGWLWLPTAMGRNSPGALDQQKNRWTELRAGGVSWCILFSAPCCLFPWQGVGEEGQVSSWQGAYNTWIQPVILWVCKTF